MNYYKQIKNGEIISYQTNSNKVEDESLFEITQEEYEQAIAEIRQQNEEIAVDENPTYEELENRVLELERENAALPVQAITEAEYNTILQGDADNE